MHELRGNSTRYPCRELSNRGITSGGLTHSTVSSDFILEVSQVSDKVSKLGWPVRVESDFRWAMGDRHYQKRGRVPSLSVIVLGAPLKQFIVRPGGSMEWYLAKTVTK